MGIHIIMCNSGKSNWDGSVGGISSGKALSRFQGFIEPFQVDSASENQGNFV